MIRRLRIVLPPAWSLAAFAAVYLAGQGVTFYHRWVGGELPPSAHRPGVIFPMLAALAYGVYRVVAFHPFYRPEYRRWLERSPWTWRKPLPLGPVSLVWEDGVVLSLLALLSLVDPGLDPVRLLTFFLISYLGALGVTLGPSGTPASAYVVAFGLGLVIRLTPEPHWALAAAILLAAISRFGLRRSLARFPWPLEWQVGLGQALMTNGRSRRAATTCGWPFDQLGPQWAKRDGLCRRETLLIGPLVGWSVLAVRALFQEARDEVGFILILSATSEVVLLAAMSRIFVYVPGYFWPISFWGRLISIRWVIPRYDVVLLGPVCTLIGPVATWCFLFQFTDWPGETCMAICLSVGLLIAMNLGPSLKRWQLTGRHRIVPTNSSDLVKLG